MGRAPIAAVRRFPDASIGRADVVNLRIGGVKGDGGGAPHAVVTAGAGVLRDQFPAAGSAGAAAVRGFFLRVRPFAQRGNAANVRETAVGVDAGRPKPFPAHKLVVFGAFVFPVKFRVLGLGRAFLRFEITFYFGANGVVVGVFLEKETFPTYVFRAGRRARKKEVKEKGEG